MIIVAGDSWGVGDWNKDGSVTRPGSIEYFLRQEGHNVWNVSLGGGSNAQTLSRLELGLDLAKQNSLPVSKVFVWQTDWLRNLQFGKTHVLKLTRDQQVIISCLIDNHMFDEGDGAFPNNAREFIERVIHYFYRSLSEISMKHDVDISVIGGCSDTLPPSESFNSKYPRLSIACHSSVNLILDIDSKDSTYSVYNLAEHQTWIFSWLKFNFKNDLKGVIAEMERSTARLNLINQHQYPYFLDNCHPSRPGYEKVFAYLKDTNQIPNEI